MRLGEEEVAEPAPEEVAGPVASCLRGDIAVGFSLVVYAGGSIEDLVACAQSRNVTALYVRDGGQYVSYIVGAPELVNRSFAGLFAGGVPALTPLIAKSDGPPSPDPSGDEPRTGDATQPWPACLRGDIAAGFNLVVYRRPPRRHAARRQARLTPGYRCGRPGGPVTTAGPALGRLRVDTLARRRINDTRSTQAEGPLSLTGRPCDRYCDSEPPVR